MSKDELTPEEEKEAKELLSTAEAATKLMEAGVPQPEFDRKPFAGLFNDENQLRRAFKKIDTVIWRSFGTDIQRNPLRPPVLTKNEIKRRFKICENWIRHARGDLGYSWVQTLDVMHHALRCELDGIPFDPSKVGSRIWTPT